VTTCSLCGGCGVVDHPDDMRKIGAIPCVPPHARRRIKCQCVLAKERDQLVLLSNELDIAQGAYMGRSHQADARKLRTTYVRAKLTFRRWWRMVEAGQEVRS
jgi:hypothetical protein